jgi:hypothetical protein
MISVSENKNGQKESKNKKDKQILPRIMEFYNGLNGRDSRDAAALKSRRKSE